MYTSKHNSKRKYWVTAYLLDLLPIFGCSIRRHFDHLWIKSDVYTKELVRNSPKCNPYNGQTKVAIGRDEVYRTMLSKETKAAITDPEHLCLRPPTARRIWRGVKKKQLF